MAESKITSKNQTTVPKGIRERLGLAPGDVLDWRIDGDAVRVRPAALAFLRRRGTLAVGPGSTVRDTRRARVQRGKEPS